MMMAGVCTGSLSLYLVVGITGYVLFGSCVCDNISVSFGTHWLKTRTAAGCRCDCTVPNGPLLLCGVLDAGPSVLVAIGQGFVVTSVSCGYATLCWPCRDAILDLCYPLYLRAIGEAKVVDSTQDGPYSAVTAAPPDAPASDSDGVATAAASTSEGRGKTREPSMLLKRVVSLLIVLSASTVAWFDPPFGAVISILGAVGGGFTSILSFLSQSTSQ